LKRGVVLSFGLVVVTLLGCASSPPLVIGHPIGPVYTDTAPSDSGTLVVYSMREARNGEQDDLIYSEYRILDLDGGLIRQVENRDRLSHREPATVELPEGRYTVHALNYRYGRVSLTADIKAGLKTIIDLTGESQQSRVPGGRWVRLPSGQIVGARAE
jgi:hypothetical protein